MTSLRTLIVIIVICFAVVITAAVVRFNTPEANQQQIPYTNSLPYSTHQIRDSRFFETEQVPVTATSTQSSPGRFGIPGFTAAAYIVGDANTGEVYFEGNSVKVLPVASMSKLITAFVATDLLSATSTITISEGDLKAPPDRSNFMAGETFSLPELLVPLLLNSSNVAAEAIASSTENRQSFLEAMSSYSWEIGMLGTFFADPSGVSPYNAASARDLFALAQYLFKYRPDILELTRTLRSIMATTTEHGSHELVSTHPFSGHPDFIGGKTGRTPEAGETMMTILNVEDHPIVIVVLGSRYGSREGDTRILLQKAKTKLGVR